MKPKQRTQSMQMTPTLHSGGWGFPSPSHFGASEVSNEASQTSILCEASTTFQSMSFQSLAPATQNAKMTSHLESLKCQNEHLVRDFLQIPHFQLENWRFRVSFSYKAIFAELKKYDFCEASATFQDTHEMLRLARYFKEPSPRHKMLRLPRHRERPHHKVLRQPRKKRRACIDSLPKYCACHAKHENDLPFCDLRPPKRAFRARLPPLFILWRTGRCRSACVPPNREKLTTTRRRHEQNNANTDPTPDPNYKREPFATHSGKMLHKYVGLSSIHASLWSERAIKNQTSKIISRSKRTNQKGHSCEVRGLAGRGSYFI